MRVAIAGGGDMARYFCEEWPQYGHQIIILTRSLKSHFDRPGVVQRVTDYSLDSLEKQLADCEVLVSTILDYSDAFVDLHLNMVEACKRSPHCKRFVPSEFGGNVEEYPDQAGFYYRTREPIRKILREQDELEWTLISVGWFIDYLVPSKNRYLKDAGEAFPIDITTGEAVVPGKGRERLDVTWARDVAKGMALLLNAPSWEPYTYFSGQNTCWNEVVSIFNKHNGAELSVRHKSLYQLTEVLKNSNDEDAILMAEYQIFSVSGAGSFDTSKVEAQRRRYFPGVHFRNVVEGLEHVKRDGEIIV